MTLDENRELLVEVSGISKKFCKSLRSSMIYGLRDLFVPVSKSPVLRPDEFWALQDVSFQLYRGETLAILGLNGAGKSTLMHVVTGTFPQTTGTYCVNGKITTIYEKNNALKKFYTGRENVRIKCALFGVKRHEMDETVNSILAFAEIKEFADATFGTYSAGMKARLNFSTACLSNPDIIIIDEGLSAADSKITEKYTRFLKDRQQNLGMLLVSHNEQLIRSLATRIIILKEGKIFHETTDIDNGIRTYSEHQEIQTNI